MDKNLTPDEKRKEIELRIRNGNFSVGAVIVEAKYTALRAYLNGGKITADKLYSVEQALDVLEAEVKK